MLSGRRALAHCLLFAATSLLLMIALGLTAGAYLYAIGASKPDLQPSDVPLGLLPILTLAQLVGFAFIGVAGAKVLNPHVPLSKTLGMQSFHPIWLVPALFGGTVGSLFSAWMNEQFISFGYNEEQLGMLTEMVNSPEPLVFVPMLAAVVIAAPVGEELAFRGYLYRAVEGYSELVAFAVSTVGFLLYHLDPLHVLSLLPTALLLGLLRYGSKSLIPPMLAHFLNNALAVVLSRWLPESYSELHIPTPLALVIVVTTFSLVALAFNKAPQTHQNQSLNG